MRKLRPNNDAGFTMVELIAGLMVANLLIAGIVDIVRRYARTTGEVREAASDIRSARLLDAMMTELARIDPGSLRLTAQSIDASIGGVAVTARLVGEASATRFNWTSAATQRSISLAPGAKFEQLASGAIALTASGAPVPLAIAIPRRTLPFDCQFDTVSRVCRQ